MEKINLNSLEITTDSFQNKSLEDFSTSGLNDDIIVYFRNLEKHLINLIDSADVVVGCVAWLTSEPILEVLSKKKGVSIIVQKEDFLRPDFGQSSNWKNRLRDCYKKIPSNLSRYDEGLSGTVLYMMSILGDPTIEAIRCVGNHNLQKESAFPRSHHKFIVLCKYIEYEVIEEEQEFIERKYVPYAVWTGSFNFTKNANMSFENAVLIKDARIVNAFFQEYAQIAAISEPLDWKSTWSAPEWRIGT